jgi:NAD+ synthase
VGTIDIAILQLNPTLGDLDGNRAKIHREWEHASENGASLVVTPEKALTGDPLDDLVFRPSFIAAVESTVHRLARDTRDGPPLLVGTPWKANSNIVNAALLLKQGRIDQVVMKRELPEYGPFHEKRHYTAGMEYKPVTVAGHKLGVAICEDIWSKDLACGLREAGAEAILAVNASPFEKGKFERRLRVARDAVRHTGLPVIYTNMVGGQDELLFDGASFVLNASGEISSSLPHWEEKTDLVRLVSSPGGGLAAEPGEVSHPITDLSSLYSGLVSSVRDYARKNGFKTAVIGLSGGIDSALTTVLACDALGTENVHALMLPSQFTSRESLDVAEETCRRLGCHYSADLDITQLFNGMREALQKRWDRPQNDLTYQNIQARLRTLFLFAVSNDEGMLVLNTSNKSEVAMGHSTFYGDTSGGYAPLKDVFKMAVYELAGWRNANTARGGLGPQGAVIDERILTREPTPELDHGEIDKDILPPYPVLDPILEGLVEKEQSIGDLVAQGFDEATVTKVYKRLQDVEFKRFQTPPGPKVSSRSFGRRERLYPLTNSYRDYNYRP